MKKILFALPMVIFLVAGCSSTQQANNSTATSTTNSPELLATINVSGSTNTAPYTININDDGSVTVAVEDKSTKSFVKETADAQTFKNLLGQIPDINLLTGGGACAKSVSFGTLTTITYNAKTSKDISCAIQTHSSQPAVDLSKFINNLELKLQINSSRSSPRIFSK